jgi:hypothetical protein
MRSWCRALTGAVAWLAVLGVGCRARVEVLLADGAGGRGSSGGIITSAGGGGGGKTACSDACVECCNLAACPATPPAEGQPCPEEIHYYDGCTYVVGGCTEYFTCRLLSSSPGAPLSWIGLDGPRQECGAACPLVTPAKPQLCLTEGKSCTAKGSSVDDTTCFDSYCTFDHHWLFISSHDCMP